MQRLILHIGTHKTGTTFIQRFLASVQEQLLSEGILYPTAGRPKATGTHQYGHHLLGWSATKMKSFGFVKRKQDWLDVLEEIHTVKAKTTVISSEAFGSCSQEQIIQLREYFADFDVKVIIYLRNQFDFMISWYKECVKSTMYKGSFQQFITENIYFCDYDSLLTKWIDVFGRDRVEIKLYDKLKRNPGLEIDLLNTLKLDPEKFKQYLFDSQRENVSPSDTKIALIKLLNLLEDKLGSRGSLRKTLRGIIPDIIKQNPVVNKFTVIEKKFFSKAIYTEDELVLIRNLTKEWKTNFLEKYVSSEDRIYFNF
ncbi:sulfotransferase domain-containing protein [Pleurocapsales cyanobacterium LEGE 06147]|nr:sulfotransferase domain-containing protein [Pleurocapsales cyanobacterium LEGE 06147]